MRHGTSTKRPRIRNRAISDVMAAVRSKARESAAGDQGASMHLTCAGVDGAVKAHNVQGWAPQPGDRIVSTTTLDTAAAAKCLQLANATWSANRNGKGKQPRQNLHSRQDWLNTQSWLNPHRVGTFGSGKLIKNQGRERLANIQQAERAWNYTQQWRQFR